LSPEEQPVAGNYRVAVADLRAHQAAAQIGSILHSRRGVANVNIDPAEDTLIVEAAANSALSPWMLMAAVQQANERPLAITGPQGRLSIEPAATAAELSSRPALQGEIR
jgi:hypothetical protein